jgi:copper homeostasis protein
MRRRVLLEVCVASLSDALAAEAAGADRLELNCALSEGGLTPSLGLLVEVKAAVGVQVIVMARPRPGGFSYADAEFAVMRRDIDLALTHGADGIAFGALHEDGRVDVDRCKQIVGQIGVRESVFHRAFDVVPRPAEALEQLIDLGVKRVLTSGQARGALDGAQLIAELRGRANGRIELLPAGGVNSANVKEVIDRTGCNQVHGSFRRRVADRSVSAGRDVKFGAGDRDETQYDATDPAAVAAVRSVLNRLP